MKKHICIVDGYLQMLHCCYYQCYGRISCDGTFIHNIFQYLHLMSISLLNNLNWIFLLRLLLWIHMKRVSWPPAWWTTVSILWRTASVELYPAPTLTASVPWSIMPTLCWSLTSGQYSFHHKICFNYSNNNNSNCEKCVLFPLTRITLILIIKCIRWPHRHANCLIICSVAKK